MKLENSKQKKVLGITIDNKLNFATHLVSITNNKSNNALTKAQNYMPAKPKIFMFSSFIRSKFFHCLLMLMFRTKPSIGRINNIHERCLRLIQQIL